MHLHGKTLTFVAITWIAAGCGGKPYDPWLAPETEFRSAVRHIAITSVGAPAELENPEPMRLLFDSLMSARLEAAGFRITPSSRVRQIWDHVLDSLGGYFDPITGRPDTAKARAALTYVVQTLQREDSADAVLFPSVVIVSAEFSERKARWDGTSQTIEGFGSAFLRALGGVSRRGRIPALSLEVDIRSPAGRRMFLNRGGIEVWEKPGDDEPVPRDQLFLDSDRNTKAVWLALRPIVGTEERGGRPQE